MNSRHTPWIIAGTFPLWFVPLWLGLWRLTGVNLSGLTTACGGLVTAMVLVSAYTDSKEFRIPNWVTYTGALWGLAINAGQSLLGNETSQQWLGAVGIGQSLIGFVVIFAGLLVIFIFSGGGAGDVKLGSAIGSYLGLKHGFEALVITYITCAVIVLLQTAAKKMAPKKNESSDGALLGEERGQQSIEEAHCFGSVLCLWSNCNFDA